MSHLISEAVDVLSSVTTDRPFEAKSSGPLLENRSTALVDQSIALDYDRPAELVKQML
jgi:hypothetical protein